MELNVLPPKRMRRKSKHTFQIKGNIFELHSDINLHGRLKDYLYRRLFVSPEFVQLFYFLHDNSFDERLYESLPENEKYALSEVLNFLDINNKDFNIALAKTMRHVYERFKVIEGAIKAGNLSTELHDEYVELMKFMNKVGMLSGGVAGFNIKAIGRTLESQNKNKK